MHGGRQGNIVRAFRNFFDSDIPFPRRIVVALRNIGVRFVYRQACCGHDGEPGC